MLLPSYPASPRPSSLFPPREPLDPNPSHHPLPIPNPAPKPTPRTPIPKPPNSHTPVSQAEVESLYRRFRSLDRGLKGYISAEEFLAIPELSINPLAQRVVRL